MQSGMFRKIVMIVLVLGLAATGARASGSRIDQLKLVDVSVLQVVMDHQCWIDGCGGPGDWPELIFPRADRYGRTALLRAALLKLNDGTVTQVAAIYPDGSVDLVNGFEDAAILNRMLASHGVRTHVALVTYPSPRGGDSPVFEVLVSEDGRVASVASFSQAPNAINPGLIIIEFPFPMLRIDPQCLVDGCGYGCPCPNWYYSADGSVLDLGTGMATTVGSVTYLPVVAHGDPHTWQVSEGSPDMY